MRKVKVGLLSHCRYFDRTFLYLLSNPQEHKEIVQNPHFDLFPWQLKVYNVELSFNKCSLRSAHEPQVAGIIISSV